MASDATVANEMSRDLILGIGFVSVVDSHLLYAGVDPLAIRSMALPATVTSKRIRRMALWALLSLAAAALVWGALLLVVGYVTLD